MARKVLNVAEKPSVAKEITRILARGSVTRRPTQCKYNPISEFQCTIGNEELIMLFTSIRGHLMEVNFPPDFSNWMRIPPVALLQAPVTWKIPAANKDLEGMLQRLSRECTDLILWLDCDREGEAIAFEVLEVCLSANPRLKVSRATFSAVTNQDIQQALASLHPPDQKLADAVAVRQELDLKIGSTLTRLMTLRFMRQFQMPTPVISYGPCQFPTLGFVVARYTVIRNFVPENFWQLSLSIKDPTGGNPIPFTWVRQRLFDKILCLAIYQRCLLRGSGIVSKAESKTVRKLKPLPLNTIGVTKLAASMFRFAAHHTMSLAESLYCQGMISYPRTETDAYPKSIDVRRLVEGLVQHPEWGSYAQGLLSGGYDEPRRGRHDDAAHPPIYPVKSVSGESSFKSADEAKLYKMICKHFLAQCSRDAVGAETLLEVDVDSETFRCKGLQILEKNFLEIWDQPWIGVKLIPHLLVGQLVELFSLLMEGGQTAPPALLSEVELITKMDKHGVGTDATMHEHIRTIETRQYVVRMRSQGIDRFMPTVLGLALFRGYTRCSRDLTTPYIRAETERFIEAVAAGRQSKTEVLATEIAKYQNLVNKVGTNLRNMEDMLRVHFPTRTQP